MGDASQKAAHLAPYRWKPGCPSPNPTGHPKSLAAHIRAETQNGKELLEILLACARGQSEDVAKWPERLKAVAMLLDHGGWPRASMELTDDDQKPMIDLSSLTPQEISAVEQLGLLVAAIRNRIASGEA